MNTSSTTRGEPLAPDAIDRTAKLYVGGKQARKGFEYAAEYGEKQTNKPVFEWDFLVSAAK